MAAIIYSLCALTSFGCAWLLLRGYWRSGAALLKWSGLCFAGLALSNLILVVDLVIVPDVDLFAVRNATTLLSMVLLLYGLIWEVK
jgi:hypothetical protein